MQLCFAFVLPAVCFPFIIATIQKSRGFLCKLFLPPPPKKLWQIFLWRPHTRCYERADPGDYNANWFATSECSEHCQLLAAIKSCCVPWFGACCHLQPRFEWCQAHPCTTTRWRGDIPTGVPGSKSPVVPPVLLWPLLSRLAPFTVLLVIHLFLSSPAPLLQLF